MCSNFEPLSPNRATWVKHKFGCELPFNSWPAEAYPSHPAPFIFLADGKVRCELAGFGLVPFWATKEKNYGKHTYNARFETVDSKRSFKPAWRDRRFGLVLMESFFEPNWESGHAVRWKIKRADDEPAVAACIWERVIDKTTGEIIMTFAMLTINADGHEIMDRFHRPEKEKRSIVILNDDHYSDWLIASHERAGELLQLAPTGFLKTEPWPKPNQKQTLPLL